MRCPQCKRCDYITNGKDHNLIPSREKPSLGRILGITKIVIGNLRSIADIIRLITSL